jgi:hypothetical protein
MTDKTFIKSKRKNLKERLKISHDDGWKCGFDYGLKCGFRDGAKVMKEILIYSLPLFSCENCHSLTKNINGKCEKCKELKND